MSNYGQTILSVIMMKYHLCVHQITSFSLMVWGFFWLIHISDQKAFSLQLWSLVLRGHGNITSQQVEGSEQILKML